MKGTYLYVGPHMEDPIKLPLLLYESLSPSPLLTTRRLSQGKELTAFIEQETE